MFETDDDDFNPSSSKNLFSIFNNVSSPDDNASLSYKAPKQPKSNDLVDSEKAKQENQSSIVLAKVINLWKSELGTNKLVGKHIVAVIGNSTQKLYEMILYKEKTNILIRQILNDSFNLYKYPKNFIGFYDSSNFFWSLSFANEEDCENFIKEASKQNCQVIDKCTENKLVKEPELVQIQNDVPLALNENSEDSKTKTDILSRITKMGQPILPKSTFERKINTEPSDSETESSYSDSKIVKPTAVPRKLKKVQSQIQSKTFSNSVHPDNTALSPFITNNAQMLPNHNQMMLHHPGLMVSQPVPDYSVNNFLIAQNTELKTNISEINMKLNSLLSNQNVVGQNTDDSKELKSTVKCLKLKIENLSSDLEKATRECTQLRKEYKEKCEELALEQIKNNESQSLNTEIGYLKQCLAEREKDIDLLKLELKGKTDVIESQQLRLNESEKYYEENRIYKENVSVQIEELEKKLEEANTKLLEQDEHCRKIETELKNKSVQNESLNNIDYNQIVKETMNDAFTDIMEHFNENEKYSFIDIQKIVLKKLKQASLTLINQINENSLH